MKLKQSKFFEQAIKITQSILKMPFIAYFAVLIDLLA